jgi:hypothetical protein
MSLDTLNLATVLSSDLPKNVFKEILKNRSALFKDIRASVSENQLPNVGVKEIERAVKTLVDASLVKERSAPIEDFNTYYVTADGLGVERMLRRGED